MSNVMMYRSNAEMPEYFAHQALSFIRIHWFDPYQYDVNALLLPEDWHPTYFVAGEGKALFAYAAAVWFDIEHDGITYKCYGLSGVHTYPAFRKKGYAGQVVKAASDYIRSDPEADIALLWTGEELETLYTSAGWQVIPNMVTQSGDKANPVSDEDAFVLMMFLSDKGKALREKLKQKPVLYVGEFTW